MYRFEKANVAKDFYMPSSNICSIYEFDENFEKNYVLALGQLKHLFGEPDYMTNNLENQFRYVIKATNEKGDVLSKVQHGIKNGEPYWEKREISEKEAEEFQEEVW